MNNGIKGKKTVLVKLGASRGLINPREYDHKSRVVLKCLYCGRKKSFWSARTVLGKTLYSDGTPRAERYSNARHFAKDFDSEGMLTGKPSAASRPCSAFRMRGGILGEC
jgi:hypothetical protein